MPKRIRLHICEASEATLEFQRQHDGIRPGTQTMPRSGQGREDVIWTSIDLDPRRITLLQVWRLLHREQPQAVVEEAKPPAASATTAASPTNPKASL